MGHEVFSGPFKTDDGVQQACSTVSLAVRKGASQPEWPGQRSESIIDEGSSHLAKSVL